MTILGSASSFLFLDVDFRIYCFVLFFFSLYCIFFHYIVFFFTVLYFFFHYIVFFFHCIVFFFHCIVFFLKLIIFSVTRIQLVFEIFLRWYPFLREGTANVTCVLELVRWEFQRSLHLYGIVN